MHKLYLKWILLSNRFHNKYWHQNAASGDKSKLSAKKLITSGVLMAGFFGGIPFDFKGGLTKNNGQVYGGCLELFLFLNYSLNCISQDFLIWFIYSLFKVRTSHRIQPSYTAYLGNIRLRKDFRKEIINYGNDKHTNVQLAKRQRQALRLDCKIHPGEFISLLR